MLEIGDKAPDFALEGDDGNLYRLKNFKGKSAVVLYFYPKDLTPGCTQEACDFRDLHTEFSQYNGVVLGVSKDSLASHVRFKGKHELSFVLLSDSDLAVHKLYEAYGEKTMYGKTSLGVLRTTYLINKDGKISRIWKKVRVKGHVQQVLDATKKLHVTK